jgi:hypothetical protein
MTEQDQAARSRLAQLIDERRDQLGLYWNEVAQLADITKEGLRSVRFETRGLRPATKRGIERALRWEPGTVDRILEGGDPEEMPTASAPSDPPVSVFDVKAILARLAAAEARLAALEARMESAPIRERA